MSTTITAPSKAHENLIATLSAHHEVILVNVEYDGDYNTSVLAMLAGSDLYGEALKAQFTKDWAGAVEKLNASGPDDWNIDDVQNAVGEAGWVLVTFTALDVSV